MWEPSPDEVHDCRHPYGQGSTSACLALSRVGCTALLPGKVSEYHAGREDDEQDWAQVSTVRPRRFHRTRTRLRLIQPVDPLRPPPTAQTAIPTVTVRNWAPSSDLMSDGSTVPRWKGGTAPMGSPRRRPGYRSCSAADTSLCSAQAGRGPRGAICHPSSSFDET